MQVSDRDEIDQMKNQFDQLFQNMVSKKDSLIQDDNQNQMSNINFEHQSSQHKNENQTPPEHDHEIDLYSNMQKQDNDLFHYT